MSKEKTSADAIESSPLLWKRALDSMDSGAIIMDVDQESNPIIFANPAFCRMTASTPEQVLAADFLQLQTGDPAQPALAVLRAAIANRQKARAVLRNLDQQGAAISQEVSISPVADENGRITHLLAIQTNVTALAGTAQACAQGMESGGHQIFSSERPLPLQERAPLEHALRSAIDNNQLQVHYQPQVDLQTGRISGVEALARWKHPELGMVPPARFIAVAEEAGLIGEIGEWVMRRACQDMRLWLDHGLTDLRVALNVSPKRFRDPMLADKIADTLDSMQIDPKSLCVEITEAALMQDTAAGEAKLERLQALGIGLVLDDFGTGFSSLSYLRRFPFNKVKIDYSFVRDIVANGDAAAISKAIISMAHSLGIRVVAEGVESDAQCHFLSQNMCDEIQGHLFSEAVTATEIETMLCEQWRLPEHFLRLQKPSRTLLLVDDEVNIVAAVKRLLRRGNYTILTANSGQEGLEVLAKHEVDVIVSDQRMPGMTGVEFLRIAKGLYPDTVRIVLSGYTELQSVTDAVNEGAIYKFLTKPWDDEQLHEHVEEAFRRKGMADENKRLNLEVRTANLELAAANRQLEEVLKQQQQQIKRDEVSLDIVREALQNVPLPVIGVDDGDVVAFANNAAQALFDHVGPILGSDATQLIPELLHATHGIGEDGRCTVELNGLLYQLISHGMGRGSQSRGKLMTLTRCEVKS